MYSEIGLIDTVDFRRGEISPTTGIYNQLRKAVRQARAAGKRIKRFRSDSAAHQNKIFEYCDRNGIEYYISLDKNEAMNESIRGIEEQQWTPVVGRVRRADRGGMGRGGICNERGEFDANVGVTVGESGSDAV